MFHIPVYLRDETIERLVLSVLYNRVQQPKKPYAPGLIAAVGQLVEQGCLLSDGLENFTAHISRRCQSEWPAATNQVIQFLANDFWPVLKSRGEAIDWGYVNGEAVAMAQAVGDEHRILVLSDLLAADLNSPLPAWVLAEIVPFWTGQAEMAEKIGRDSRIKRDWQTVHNWLENMKRNLIDLPGYLAILPADALAPAAAYMICRWPKLTWRGEGRAGGQQFFAAGAKAARTMDSFLSLVSDMAGKSHDLPKHWLAIAHYLFVPASTLTPADSQDALLFALETLPFNALVELLAGGIAVEAKQHRPTMSYLASLATGGQDLLITLSKREAGFVAADWWDKW